MSKGSCRQSSFFIAGDSLLPLGSMSSVFAPESRRRSTFVEGVKAWVPLGCDLGVCGL